MKSYYLEHLDDYRVQIESLGLSLRRQIEPIVPENELDVLMDRLWEDFTSLLPEIPYIGGKANPLTENLLGAAYEMGFYEVLEARGMDLEDISDLNRKALSEYTRKKLNPDALNYIKKNVMTKDNFIKGALASQEREFSGDWVYEYVEPGINDDFDFGINYRSCAIVDLYVKRGNERFLPYVCSNDYAVFKELDVYFERDHTMGNGDCLCDFRFRVDSASGLNPVNSVKGLREYTGQTAK